MKTWDRYSRRSGSKLTQDSTDSGVQFFTLACQRWSFLFGQGLQLIIVKPYIPP